MKILWLSSVKLSEQKNLVSGTWVPGLHTLLKNRFGTELDVVNLTYGKVSTPTKVETESISEWIIPFASEMTFDSIKHINNIIQQESPDIIQVWGTEDIWGMYPFSQLASEIPAVLEIQGILASVSEEYYGGLTPMELFKCWNIKEWLKPSSSLPAIRNLYTRHICREDRILRSFKYIGVQSKWSADVVRTYNPTARLFKSGIALRQPFYSSKKWRKRIDNEIRVFSTALMGQPLKGGYTLFKAFAIVYKQFPNAKLILVGAKEDGIRRSGFWRLLTKYAQKNGFYDAIEHLGPADAEQLVEQYRMASVFVNPSNWESYSVVTAEAMLIGCPVVAAYSGAMPELGVNDSVLYFPKGDYRICASRILDILNDSSFAESLSRKSIAVAEQRQDRNIIADNQMEVYRCLLELKK